jgi:hypothetical protein
MPYPRADVWRRRSSTVEIAANGSEPATQIATTTIANRE